MAALLDRSRNARSGVFIAATLGAATVLAWWALYRQQTAMAALPMDQMWMPPTGTWQWSAADFGLTWNMWAIMMLAMMLPVAAPMTVLIRRLGQDETIPTRVHLPAFLAGYFLVWMGFSGAATLLQWLFHGLRWLTPMMDPGNTRVAGGILILAGLYQFSRWKTACLSHCRAPIGFLLNHARPGWRGGLRLGLHHGRYCLGCCWAEMLVMFAVGVMNLLWMGAITLGIVAERYVPAAGEWVRRLAGLGLLAFGMAVWL